MVKENTRMKFTNKTPEVRYYFILDGTKTAGTIYYENFGTRKFQWTLMFGRKIEPANILDLCHKASSENWPISMMDAKVSTELEYIAVMPKEL
nr:MAG TPA: hypothetical protein [Caudoviricetes sp.]